MVLQADSFPADAVRRWQLYQRDQPELARRALRLTGNSADAADLVQELALLVLRHPTGPSPDACFRAWCFGLLRNVASDQRRAAGRRARRELLGVDDMVNEIDGHTSNPELHLDLRRLADRVQALEGGARELVVRRYLLEETATEIARDVRSSPPAIRMKLKRLRTKLRDLLSAAPVLAASFCDLIAVFG